MESVLVFVIPSQTSMSSVRGDSSNDGIGRSVCRMNEHTYV